MWFSPVLPVTASSREIPFTLYHFVPLGDPYSPLFKLYIKNNYNRLTFHWGSSPSLALVVIQLRIQHSSACCLTYSQRRRPLNLIHCSVTPCQKKFKTYSNLWPKPTINQLWFTRKLSGSWFLVQMYSDCLFTKSLPEIVKTELISLGRFHRPVNMQPSCRYSLWKGKWSFTLE